MMLRKILPFLILSREHSLQQMKRMPNHGSQLHMGSSSMLADPNYQGGKRKKKLREKKTKA